MDNDEQDILMEKFHHALDLLSPEELAQLYHPKYVMVVRAVRIKNKKDTDTPIFDTDEIQYILQTLNCFEQRDEAYEFLDSCCRTKKHLQAVAQALEILVSKSDRIAELKERIVEATVGAKIRSKAIQGIS